MNTGNKKENFLIRHTDFQYSSASLVATLVAALCVACIFLLPDTVSGKNSLPEYLQLLLLFIGIVMSFRADNNKQLYTFAGFVLLLLLLREVNFGRTLPWFADPEDPNKFKKWKEIPYGWLAHVFIGVYIAALVAFFFVRKLYINIWQLLRTVKFPLWECLIIVTAALCAQATERIFHSDFVEEFFELAFYGALMCLVWRFTRGKYRTTDSL